ncbi:hypothetical protein CRP804_gp16 [Roseobacter phage CRP-804]|uniref:Uncharacterized protein n=1 Tax=Roseobacter phage CRP-804 TaxID=3072850 RepID=A0AAX3ZV60_9CAUD|nr:hypothetical protein CRP804_gp16 [Roseobacter phage CRP-804]
MARQRSATTGSKPTKQAQETKPKVVRKVCETCRFLDSQGSDRFRTHFCRRYPKTEIVTPDYWCGEWSAKDE